MSINTWFLSLKVWLRHCSVTIATEITKQIILKQIINLKNGSLTDMGTCIEILFFSLKIFYKGHLSKEIKSFHWVKIVSGFCLKLYLKVEHLKWHHWDLAFIPFATNTK